jgi:glycosyltransferase involved in cell wall biosynthesis
MDQGNLGQTCTAIDVIVVNDGSTDNVGAAIAPFRGRITVILRTFLPPGLFTTARSARRGLKRVRAGG